jgi:hypothetical protein
MIARTMTIWRRCPTIPHGSQVEANFGLKQGERKQIQLKEKHLR